MADLVTLCRYEPAPRYYHISQSVGRKVLVHSGWAKPEISDQSKQHLKTLVEIFDPYYEIWEQKQVDGEAPAAGTYAAVSTSVGGNLFTFGGLNSSNQEVNALHKLDTNATPWQWYRLRSHQDSPMPKYGCGMVAFGPDKLGVFGGYGKPRGPGMPDFFEMDTSSYSGSFSSGSHRGWTNELHEYHLEKGVWSCPATTGERPPPCAGFTFTAIDDRRAVLFGGVNGLQGKLSDVYIIDTLLKNWTKLSASGGGPWPEERSRHAACCLNYGQRNPQLLVTAGEDSQRKTIADAWILDVERKSWKKVNTAIRPRYAHTMAAFSLSPEITEVIMFGGKEGGCLLSDTLLFRFMLQRESWDLRYVLTHDELGSMERLAQKVQTTSLSAAEDHPEPPSLTLAEPEPKLNSRDEEKVEKVKSPVQEKLHELIINYEIELSDLRFGAVVGQGGFGTVYQGRWKSKGIDVALKRVNLPPEECDAKVMAELGEHPNIISFFGFARSHPDIIIVTAFAKNGSLYDYLHKKGETPMQQQSLTWAKQIAYGMAYMHKLELVHRDLKSSNILFTNDMTAQICDFGTSRTLKETTFASKAAGTLRWMAPEVAEETAINKTCDVFSFSLVVWELIEHKIPFHDCPSQVKASMKIISGERPPISPDWPKYLANLIRESWSPNPHVRPSFADIVTSLDNKTFFKRYL